MTDEELIQQLEDTVAETLAYFDGPGQTTDARVGDWAAWDVLAHFLYWHQATAWGIASASAGGPPWKMSAGADEANRVTTLLHQGESFADLLAQLRGEQERLVRAARALGDLDLPATERPDGELLTARQRLERIAAHWSEHLRELREASD